MGYPIPYPPGGRDTYSGEETRDQQMTDTRGRFAPHAAVHVAQVCEAGSEPDPSGLPVEDLRLLGAPFVSTDGETNA